jgi:hypothetical protein
VSDRGRGWAVAQVRPFSVSPLLDGRLLVFRTGESVREADFYSELWNAPGDMLADVIARWLGDSGLFSVVVPPGTAGTATDLVLEAGSPISPGTGATPRPRRAWWNSVSRCSSLGAPVASCGAGSSGPSVR